MSEAALEESAVEPVAAESAPEPAAVEAPAPVAETYSRAELEAEIEARLAPISQYTPLLEQLAQMANQPQAPAQSELTQASFTDEYGNVDWNAWNAYQDKREQRLLAAFDQRLEKIAAPLAAREEAENERVGNERIQDVIADDISRNGDFPTDPETGKSPAKDLVRPLADLLFATQIAPTYGATARGAELAVQKAAALVREVVAVSGKAAVTAHENRNASLLGATRQPGPGAPGLETRPDTVYKRGELVAKFAANADAIRSGT